jgi:hypothetical protein
MPGAFTLNAAHESGQASAANPDILIWTGTLKLVDLSQAELPVHLQTAGNGNFWKLDTNAGLAFVDDDTLSINVIPEPASVVMLAPAVWLLYRRRRQA